MQDQMPPMPVEGEPEMEMEEPAEAMEPMESTIEASIESLGGAQVGDTVTLKVASIDEETGMATLTPSNASPKTSSIEQAAGEFE